MRPISLRPSAAGDPCNWTFFSASTLRFYGDPNNEFAKTGKMYRCLEDSTAPAAYPRGNYAGTNDTNDIEVPDWHA
jgi:hypothetical protein